MAGRSAIYFLPDPKSALARCGARWFASERISDWTAQPSIYGFHATLKAPFAVAEGKTPDALEAALAAFCASRSSVKVGPLRLARMSGFLALVPERPPPALEQLARDLVARFDDFRAPLDTAEFARRRAAGLSPRQEDLLARWGYPYVMEEFRFHMTLTRRLADAEAEEAEPLALRSFAEALKQPLRLDSLSHCRQAKAGAAFREARRFDLTGTQQEGVA